MSTSHIVLYLSVFLVLFNAANAQSIVVSSFVGNSPWWLAYSVSDPSTTSVDLMDSGAYSTWRELESSNWGYWIFNTAGVAVTFPVSLRLKAGDSQVIVQHIFSSAAPNQAVDTLTSYGGIKPTLPPYNTDKPVTPAPTNKPSTPAPTHKPSTPAPTNKPSTPAPTNKPSTPAPTNKPSTPAPTNKPSTPAPTNKPSTPAPANTPAPTNKPSTPAPANTPAPTNRPANQGPVGGNPFAGTQYYINPHYTMEVDSSIATNPSLATKLAKVKTFASAFWVDRMAVIDNVTTILTQAKLQATQSGKQVMAAIVVYDLPARDCAAAASNGEIQCADATCADGINTYKTKYIDPLVAVLKNFPDITIVTIVEPDSLPNLATNLANPKCTLAQTAYITGVSYAIQQLSALSNVYIYVDAAHGGWLGWDQGRNAAVAVFKQVLTLAGGAAKIRGFATNVANYQPLGSMTDAADPCKLASQYNFAINEVKYVSMLDTSLSAVGITGMKYIIDTGRNGVIDSRTDCSNWCNIKKAGLGLPPTANTASSGLSNIDAYFWVKPPGESDGTSDTSAARYDYHCGSADSFIPAPEAGNWFSNAFVSMAQNANPSL